MPLDSPAFLQLRRCKGIRGNTNRENIYAIWSFLRMAEPHAEELEDPLPRRRRGDSILGRDGVRLLSHRRAPLFQLWQFARAPFTGAAHRPTNQAPEDRHGDPGVTHLATVEVGGRGSGPGQPYRRQVHLRRGPGVPTPRIWPVRRHGARIPPKVQRIPGSDDQSLDPG